MPVNNKVKSKKLVHVSLTIEQLNEIEKAGFALKRNISSHSLKTKSCRLPVYLADLLDDSVGFSEFVRSKAEEYAESRGLCPTCGKEN